MDIRGLPNIYTLSPQLQAYNTHASGAYIRKITFAHVTTKIMYVNYLYVRNIMLFLAYKLSSRTFTR